MSQLKDELDAMYKRLTDPEEREKEDRRERRERALEEQKEDYGL